MTNYRHKLEQLKGQRARLEQDIDSTEKKLKQIGIERKDADQAQLIIQTVAQQTQEQLEYHVSEIVSLALSAVFDTPYQFCLEFNTRRGKTEADLLFKKRDKMSSPMDSAGGGAVDIAAFSLRVALWSLRQPNRRNVLCLDEPFSFLSRDLQPRASAMLKEVSEKLKLQIIMVSHSEDLIESADRTFQVKMRKGISEVKRV